MTKDSEPVYSDNYTRLIIQNIVTDFFKAAGIYSNHSTLRG
jgi:hypothetical protein